MPEDGMIEHKYGLRFPHQYTEFELELLCFRDQRKADLTGYSRAYHFKQAANLVWGEKTHAAAAGAAFIWHPWADRMTELACEHMYLSVIGAASSGKTDWAAIWALLNWLCAPKDTLVLVTSTSLKDSRRRIWGSILKYYRMIPPGCGKLVNSIGAIRTDDGSGVFSDKEGIQLIAGEKSKEQEAIGKWIGMKNKRVIMLADELPELSPAIIEAATSNLSSNPHFQLVGIGNFASIYDPLGMLTTPKDGWDAVSPADTEWETEKGYCLRLDGLKSPNILCGEDRWPIYNSVMLARHRKDLGENTIGFWRMVRSFPCPEGVDDVIYSEADLLMGKAHDKPEWGSQPIRVAGMDPSFTSGGDRAVLMLGWVGVDREGLPLLAFDRFVILREDIREKEKPRNFQIAEQFRDICIREGVHPKNTGLDATGPGIVFHDIVAQTWSPLVLRVEFGGAASELPVGTNDMRPANTRYYNRVAEIWHVGLDFIKSGRIKGLPREMAREMKARKYDMVKGSTMRIRVESKRDMKERIGYSPDIADAGFVLLDVARARLGFKAGRIPGSGGASPGQSLRERKDAANDVFDSVDYSEQDMEEVYAGH